MELQGLRLGPGGGDSHGFCTNNGTLQSWSWTLLRLPGPSTELKPPPRYRKLQSGKTDKKQGEGRDQGLHRQGRKVVWFGLGFHVSLGAPKATLTTW